MLCIIRATEHFILLETLHFPAHYRSNTTKQRGLRLVFLQGDTIYVNRKCRYRALIVAGGGIGSALGRACKEHASRLKGILENWCTFHCRALANLNVELIVLLGVFWPGASI